MGRTAGAKHTRPTERGRLDWTLDTGQQGWVWSQRCGRERRWFASR
jgi:hypothetical protein